MSSSENNIRVGIAGNALVASFLTAEAPRVWRTDLGQLLTAALEVQTNQGKYTLVMKRSDAPAEEIATFSTKEEAVKAMQLITDALLEGNDVSAHKKCGWPKKLLKILMKVIAGLCVFIVLLNIIMVLSHKSGSRPDNYTKAPAVQTGVPAPADEILGK